MRLPGPRLDIGQSLVGYTLQFNDESLWEIYPQQEMSFAGYRTVPRLDIPCSSYLAVQLLSTPLFIEGPGVLHSLQEAPGSWTSSITLYSPFHRPGYPCQSEPGDVRDVHMPFEHCLPIHGF